MHQCRSISSVKSDRWSHLPTKGILTMYLENGRDIFRGVLILVFSAIAYWGNLSIGLVLVAFIGVMILQSAFTNWCPADLILRPLGLKQKLEKKEQKR
jgi:hypothetical protein